MTFWTSKLGNKFFKAEIEDNEQIFKAQLDQLRRLTHNYSCADCGQQPTVWASVNLGVFLCMRCASIHRGIGTHISIPKGCTGTYLWGPDEIERMTCRGNEYCIQIYGGTYDRPSQDDTDETWRQYIINKYEHEKYVNSFSSPQLVHCSSSDSLSEVQQNTTELKRSQIEGHQLNSSIPAQHDEDFFARYGL